MHGPDLLPDVISGHDRNSVAIIQDSVTLTYGDLDDAITSTASRLISEFDLRKGERVALLIKSDWRFIVSLYGVIRAGGIAVPVDFRSSRPEFDYIVENTDSVVQIVDETKEGYVSKRCRGTIRLSAEISGGDMEKHPVFPELEASDTAVIFYTGGTTGFPKGVPLSHTNILHILRSLSSIWSLEGGNETFVQFLPMTHSGGFNCSMNTCLFNGGRAVIMERFSPSVLLDNIEKYNATVIVGVPTVYSSLVKNGDLSSRDLGSMKIFFSSGAKLSENIAEDFHRATGMQINVGWGLTEASPQLTVAPPGQFRKNYVGSPLPGTEVVSVDDHGKILEKGKTGNLAARGPQVMSGYWKNGEKSLSTFTDDGYLLTGDLGYVENDGVYLMGRSKDVIISGGYKIWRSEVENALLEHECVEETAVIGVQDPLYGETVKAFIVPKCKTDSEDLVNFCRNRISAYKVPRIIEFRESLPKSSLGKILHKILESENADNQVQ